MTRKPLPRKFTDLDAFTAAMVTHYTGHLPHVDRFDGYDEAKVKSRAIADATELAKETAWDDWSNFIEACEDAYERGGPAWD